MKRVFDILFSLFALITLLPLFLLISFGILLSSRGGVIYSQHRLGQGGKTFNCLKFRSMYLNAEKRLDEILQNNPGLRAEWREKQKLRADPRTFSFGEFLRKTSLDELPQFWNVLKGDLSIVGPRPYMINQRSELGPHAFKILSIRPGITGLWQTSGRNDKTFHERILLDAEYVAKNSFWLDLQLIAKTLPVVFSSKDAF
ncbi:MAG: UDP-glucose:undecaprenyl-phosphate glucose-1-phosphate transferase [Chlamydiae bacterium]|nr:UDP-glucose:undecaprenyl-phosphate glucose-1-phosphate transferase [Chlamydiota bacterium]